MGSVCLKNEHCLGHCLDGRCVDRAAIGGICVTGLGCRRDLTCDQASHRCRPMRSPFVRSTTCLDHGDCLSTEYCRNGQCTNKLAAGGLATSGWETCADGHTEFGGFCRRLCSQTGPHVVGCPVDQRCSIWQDGVIGVCLPIEHRAQGPDAPHKEFDEYHSDYSRERRHISSYEDESMVGFVSVLICGGVFLLGIFIFGIITLRKRRNKKKSERVTLQPASIAVPMEVARPAGLNRNPIMFPPPPMMPPGQMPPIYSPSPMMMRPDGAFYSSPGPSSPIYDQPPPAYSDLPSYPREGPGNDGYSGDIAGKK